MNIYIHTYVHTYIRLREGLPDSKYFPISYAEGAEAAVWFVGRHGFEARHAGVKCLM